jgi:hypothetical protein
MYNTLSHSEKRKEKEHTICENWIKFEHTKLATSAIKEIANFLKSKDTPWIQFDNERIIYQRNGNFFIIEYKSEEVMKGERETFLTYFKTENFFPKREKGGWQIPEVDFEAEYKWKYYLLLEALLKLKEQTITEKWVYKWVIINPKKYFNITNERKNSKKRVKDIIEEKK